MMNIPECDNVRSITAEYGVVHGKLNVDTGVLTLHPQKPRTNADRIRSMSDEELAYFLVRYVLNLDGAMRDISHDAWLGWLKHEVKEGE